MSENTEVVEFAFDKMEKYFDAAKTIIEQYGGDVAELGLMALRIEAGKSILISTVVFLAFLYLANKFYRLSTKQTDMNCLEALDSFSYDFEKRELIEKVTGVVVDYQVRIDSDTKEKLRNIKYIPSSEWSELRITLTIAAIVSSVVSSIAFLKLINIWLWVGIFYPELYAVHKFILN